MKKSYIGFLGVIIVGILLSKWDVQSLELDKVYSENRTNALLVDLSLIQGAASLRAVCLDGTLPGYHLHSGSGNGANSWLVNLEGGAITLQHVFTAKRLVEGLQHFYNWNRVKIRYCDGASFAGDSENKAAGLQFRGQHIWEAAMEELMSKGMRNANQALVSGCSAGGLASILHCDQFRDLFPATTKVKCLSDAGFFLDASDVSGGQTIRNFFAGVVSLQGVERNLPSTCTNHLDPTSCFFPQNLIANVKAPLFILNAAYDSWQVGESLAPPTADPEGNWRFCRRNIDQCSTSQIQFLQGFRDQMLNAIKGLETSLQSGLFINSCFLHCQSELQDRWFADHSPAIDNKVIATSVGDWYFDRANIKAIDCAYPCDKTCHPSVHDKSSLSRLILLD